MNKHSYVTPQGLGNIFLNLKTTECPHCGAKPKSYTRSNKHTNGHYNEEVEFDCGQVLKFSPNFMAEIEPEYSWYLCKMNPKKIEEKEKDIQELEKRAKEAREEIEKIKRLQENHENHKLCTI